MLKKVKSKNESGGRGLFARKLLKPQAPPRVKLTGLMSILTSKEVWKLLIKIQLTKFDPTGGK